MATDGELLSCYLRQSSEEAFSALVGRHLNLVYSAALRQVRSPQLAEEVSQSVFTDLVRSAGKLKPDTILTAWLYQVARRTAIDVVRRESRRQARERIAAEMAAMNTATDWTQIEPLLDEGMNALDESDRTALLLRYFDNKSLREVGEMLGISDDAAQSGPTNIQDMKVTVSNGQQATVHSGSGDDDFSEIALTPVISNDGQQVQMQIIPTLTYPTAEK